MTCTNIILYSNIILAILHGLFLTLIYFVLTGVFSVVFFIDIGLAVSLLLNNTSFYRYSY